MVMGTIFTVSEVNKIVKDLLSQNRDFANIQVQGEISNFHKYPSGHCYFSLKDKKGALKAVMFAGAASRLRVLPQNGDLVLALGRIDVYERDGVYQLYVDMLLPRGAGNLMLAYEKLKNKLLAEGLFDQAKKIVLPEHPAIVGIITSPAGAAVRDIITVSRRRNRGIKLLLYPVRVQGSEAAEEIVQAIRFMNKNKLADVLIVGRGGGSIEDLWAFNEEKVVRAIAASSLPIVSAVGHETDFTLADFAADVRAATPSAAAEIVVKDSNTVLESLEKLGQRNMRAMEHILSSWQTKLQGLERAWFFTQPERLFSQQVVSLDQLTETLQQQMKSYLNTNANKLQLLGSKLVTLSPMSVMARGYTVTETEQGKLVKKAQELQPGMKIITKFLEGSTLSCVEESRKVDK